jgi:hypothetical protein
VAVESILSFGATPRASAATIGLSMLQSNPFASAAVPRATKTFPVVSRTAALSQLWPSARARMWCDVRPLTSGRTDDLVTKDTAISDEHVGTRRGIIHL